MPSSTERPMQGAKDLPPCQDASDAISQLVSLLHRYCSEGSFDTLKGIVGENEDLKRDMTELQIAYNTNIRALSQFQSDSKQQKEDFERRLNSQKAQNEATLKAKQAAEEGIKTQKTASAALEKKLEGQSASAKQLMNEIKKKDSTIVSLEASKASQQDKITKAEKELAALRGAQKSMKERVANLTANLNETQRNLATFQSFMVKLDHLEGRRAEVENALDGILRSALSLVESSIGIALDDACLADTSIWGKLRNNAAIQRTIPLPASNSPAAKQMRVAAGLRIYGIALADHVFKPTCLTQGNDFDDVLRDLETEDPLHEAFTRAVLLRIQPARQARIREARVQMVVAQVLDAIADLVPGSRRETFEARLHQASMEACNTWSIVQQLLEPISPVFSSHMFEEWVPLRTSTDQPNNKAGPPSAPETLNKNQDRQSQSPTAGAQPMATDDIVQVVWPAFAVASSQQEEDDGISVPELIHRGYVVTRSQVREADDEVSRRNARKNARQNSAQSTTQKKRRDSAVFLSKGFSGGAGTEKG
ncbi:hypothetical protein ACJ41O_010871 [Fusarium nematophilum]